MNAQNFITNGDMETYTTCITNVTGLVAALDGATCQGWSAPTNGTSDYMNSCTDALFIPGIMGVPVNSFGSQAAISGNAYIGMYSYYSPATSGVLEFVQNELTSTLTNGTQYFIEINISLGDNSKFYLDDIGCIFSNTQVNTGTDAQLTNTPDVIFTGTLNDKTNWMNLTATYTANGTENFVVFGNFTPNASTTASLEGTGTFEGTYYYMDDVSITIPTLPIELLSFSGRNMDDYNELNWKTATEINNERFIIERSINAKDFKEMGEVKGAGNSNELLNYSFIDAFPKAGVNYYRLKQIDFDGEFSYSDIISLENEQINPISIFPNPINNQMVISGEGIDINNIQFYNVLGQNVTSFMKILKQNSISFLIDTSNLTSGMYFVKIANSTQKVYKN